MDYVNKYIEALSRARKIHSETEFDYEKGMMEEIFPELKEEENASEFRVWDWVIGRATENEPRQISEVTKDGYKTTYGGWIGSSFEKDMHLWTIEDAKDGDILVNKHGVIFINDDSRKGKVTLDSYCYLSVQYEFCINEHKTGSWLYKDGIKPATKEQRDFFFAKMKKAGYEWDAENKTIKKL